MRDNPNLMSTKKGAFRFWRLLVSSFLALGSGLIGGLIIPLWIGWIPASKFNNPSSAIDIANTYIVFTTIIFTATTVILVIIGYVFAHQFSESKEDQLRKLQEELKEKLVNDTEAGVTLMTKMFENEEIRAHIIKEIDKKIIQASVSNIDNIKIDTESDLSDRGP